MPDYSETENLIGSDSLHEVIHYDSNDNTGGPGNSSTESVNFNALGSSTLPGTIAFKDISYDVKSRKQCCSGKFYEKQILKEINGIFKPGMNAVMGPTGSGKTSLIDALASRKNPQGLKGTILLNGKPLPHNFRLMVGYVAQDDRVSGMLTIRENLTFSAALRLPTSVTVKERSQRVEQVIIELGLSQVADSRVGNEFVQGISGGERKRCNIGMELVISPPLLFLDEPTTGLDASTANAVMMQLKKLSSNGRTIIFSIHQPRYSIYQLFDSLLFLSNGSVVYQGPSKQAMKYFKSAGYACDKFNNPADFFLDVINGDSSAVTSHHKSESGEKTKVRVDPSHLGQHYLSSKWWLTVNQDIKVNFTKYEESTRDSVVVAAEAEGYKTGFLSQFETVSGRVWKNLYRNPHIFAAQFIVLMVYAFLVGGIYYQLDDSIVSGIQNRVGAFFLIIMNQIFGNMSAVELFIQERAIFIHENVGGFYRVSSYFLSKIFCDVIPMRLIPSLIFSAIAYFMIGLRPGFEYFVVFVLTSFGTSISSAALAFFFSSAVHTYSVANLGLALCYVFMMLFGGLLINVGDLGVWISWMKYASIFRYALNALSINELKDQQFCGNITDTNPIHVTSPNISCIYGNVYLDTQNIAYKTPMDLWWNIIALLLFTLFFLSITYVQLRRMKKLK